MKTFARTIVWLALIIWLGGLFFFPITAWASFGTIADTHAAGTVVAKCLNVLHHEGFFAGIVILLFIGIGLAARAFASTAYLAILVTMAMIGLTMFSQFGIIPKMEADRIAVGGAIDSVPKTDPHHADFDRLHRQSEYVEEGIMFSGVVLVVLLAHASGGRPEYAAQ